MEHWQEFHGNLCSSFKNPVWFTGTFHQYRILDGFNSTISLTRADIEKTNNYFINCLNRFFYGSKANRRNPIRSPHLRKRKAAKLQKNHFEQTKKFPALPYKNHFIEYFSSESRLGYAPVIEGSTSAERTLGQGTKHLHTHALIDCPPNVDLKIFKSAIRVLWSSLEWSSGCITDLQDVDYLEGVADYEGKSSSKTGEFKTDNFSVVQGDYHSSPPALRPLSRLGLMKTNFYRKASLRMLQREAKTRTVNPWL